MIHLMPYTIVLYCWPMISLIIYHTFTIMNITEIKYTGDAYTLAVNNNNTVM